VLGRKVVKAKENFFVFLQALAGLWKFDLVTVGELLLRCQSRFAGQGRVESNEAAEAPGQAKRVGRVTVSLCRILRP
jgi:hypothetical protein